MTDETKPKLNILSRPDTIIIDDEKIVPDLSMDSLSFTDSDFDFADDILETTTKELVPNKSAKETLIEFIKTAPFDSPYIIPHNGTYESAQMFIQRMRVELSRFRAQIIKLNKPLNRFYVLTQSIVIESEIKCVITLIKSKERARAAKKKSEEINDVLDFLTNPE